MLDIDDFFSNLHFYSWLFDNMHFLLISEGSAFFDCTSTYALSSKIYSTRCSLESSNQGLHPFSMCRNNKWVFEQRELTFNQDIVFKHQMALTSMWEVNPYISLLCSFMSVFIKWPGITQIKYNFKLCNYAFLVRKWFKLMFNN